MYFSFCVQLDTPILVWLGVVGHVHDSLIGEENE
jgi:hypothetical protein